MAATPPEPYLSMKKHHPDVFAAVESLGEVLRRQGPVDGKTSHLIQLAAAAAIRSEGAVHSHTRRALAAGASPAEIRQALLLLICTIGFPGVMAAMSWAEDVLGKESGGVVV